MSFSSHLRLLYSQLNRHLFSNQRRPHRLSYEGAMLRARESTWEQRGYCRTVRAGRGVNGR